MFRLIISLRDNVEDADSHTDHLSVHTHTHTLHENETQLPISIVLTITLLLLVPNDLINRLCFQEF